MSEVLILLGAPASGKGTQAKRLCSYYGFEHLSTGDILRQNIKKKTTIGEIAKKYIDNGILVPDSVVMEIVQKQLKELDGKTVLSDGFPRTLNQAKELKSLARVGRVINLNVEFSQLLERVCGRRVCENCGKIFHVYSHNGVNCDCGGALFTRDDDNEATLRVRYDQYLSLTQPLIDFYKTEGNLKEVDGSGTPDMVFDSLKRIIDSDRR